MAIWPDANDAQNNMMAVSADGSTVSVVIAHSDDRDQGGAELVEAFIGRQPILGDEADDDGRRPCERRRTARGRCGLLACVRDLP
jgi:hypothetical protein